MSAIKNEIELQMIAAGSYALAVIEPCEKTVEARRLLRNALRAMAEKYGVPSYEERHYPCPKTEEQVFPTIRLVKAQPMSVIHLGHAKGKDQEARRECNEFIGLVRKQLCEQEHGTFPEGVYLRFDNTEFPRIGVMVEYAPDVIGATETALKYADQAERLWSEAHTNTHRPKIIKHVKMNVEDLTR